MVGMTSRAVPPTDQLEPLVIAVTRPYTMATSLTDTGGRRMREQKSFSYEDTPTLPGARFRVHDGTRPQPRIGVRSTSVQNPATSHFQ